MALDQTVDSFHKLVSKNWFPNWKISH